MKFNVNTTTQFNQGSKYKSKAERSHKLAHSSRYQGRDVQYYSKNNVDLKMSKYNGKPLDNMVDGKTPYQLLYNRYHDMCVAHDIKQFKQTRQNRMYGQLSIAKSDLDKGKIVWTKDPTKEYLKTRWLKPIRTLPLKLETQYKFHEKTRLIRAVEKTGHTYDDYAKSVRQGYANWANSFNASSDYLKITNLHLNLDEDKGGDHGHVDFLGLGKTKSGRPSLSFNNAMKIYLGGKNDYKHPAKLNYHVASQKFIHKISTDLQKNVSKAFHNNGIDITLVQQHHARNPNTYINNLGQWEEQQDVNREQRQLLNSADKQNSKLKAEVKNLRKTNGQLRNQLNSSINPFQYLMLKKKYEDIHNNSHVVPNDLLKQEAKSVNSLVSQNKQLKSRLRNLKATYQSDLYSQLQDYYQSFSDSLTNLAGQLHSLKISQVSNRDLNSLEATLNSNQTELNKIESLAYSAPLKDKPNELQSGYKHVLNEFIRGLTNKKLNADGSENKNENGSSAVK